MTHLSGVWFTATDLEVTSGRPRRAGTVDDRGHLNIAASSTGHSRKATA